MNKNLKKFRNIFRIEMEILRARVLRKEAQPSPMDQTPLLCFETTSKIHSPPRFKNKISYKNFLKFKLFSLPLSNIISLS